MFLPKIRHIKIFFILWAAIQIFPILPAKNDDKLPKIGSRLSKKEVPSTPIGLAMTSPADLYPFIWRTVDKVKYKLSYDDRTWEVGNISTSDANFRTIDGLRYGDRLEIDRDNVISNRGWEIHGPKTKDGWTPVIGFSDRAAVYDMDKRENIAIEGLGAYDRRRVKILYFMKEED